jgi:hypothetical protein
MFRTFLSQNKPIIAVGCGIGCCYYVYQLYKNGNASATKKFSKLKGATNDTEIKENSAIEPSQISDLDSSPHQDTNSGICIYWRDFQDIVTKTCNCCQSKEHDEKICPKLSYMKTPHIYTRYIFNSESKYVQADEYQCMHVNSQFKDILNCQHDDRNQCDTAAVFPYYVSSNGCKYILFVQNDVKLLQFFTGQRDNNKETSKNIAARQFLNEMTPIPILGESPKCLLDNTIISKLSNGTGLETSMYWDEYLKYGLFAFELVGMTDTKANFLIADHKFEEISELQWMSFDMIRNNPSYFEKWVFDILMNIDTTVSLDNFA